MPPVDCFAALAMTDRGVVDCFVAALLAMTEAWNCERSLRGAEGDAAIHAAGGLLRCARNDGLWGVGLLRCARNDRFGGQ